MPGDPGPPLVIDATVAEHLEILQVVHLGRIGLVEGIGHAEPFERSLLDAIDRGGRRNAGNLEHGRGNIDDMGELRADLVAGLNSLGPVHDRAIAGTAPVGRDLLGPLVRGIHGMRPADRIVVVRLRAAKLVELAYQKLGRFDGSQTVEIGHLVEAAVDGSFGRGAVVPNDVVDERIVGDAQIVERIEQPADMLVGVFHEGGIDLHLADQHRFRGDRHPEGVEGTAVAASGAQG